MTHAAAWLEIRCNRLQNGYIEYFNLKLREESPHGCIYFTMLEPKDMAERWRCHYNRARSPCV